MLDADSSMDPDTAEFVDLIGRAYDVVTGSGFLADAGSADMTSCGRITL